MTEYRYAVEILHLLVSPSHAYFGRARDGAADVPTFDAETAEVVAGKGIVGDRFFGKAAHMDAAVTLFAVESLEAIAAELGAEPFNPLLTRRNVVLRGAHLVPLLGQDFVLESGGDAVAFHGGRHAQPCASISFIQAQGWACRPPWKATDCPPDSSTKSCPSRGTRCAPRSTTFRRARRGLNGSAPSSAAMASRDSTANSVTAASMCAALPKNLSPTMPLPATTSAASASVVGTSAAPSRARPK